MRMRTAIAAVSTLAFGIAAGTAHAGATFDAVKKKGFVQCGVNTGLRGLLRPRRKGRLAGFDVDYCRAVAAAVFGDATKVKFTPLTAKERFTALQSGEIDMLSRNTTWTMSRDSALGLTFAGVNYYDGQGFMVKKELGVTSAPSSTAPPSACRPARPPSSTSPTTSALQQDEVQAGRVREGRRESKRLRRRPLRRAAPPTRRGLYAHAPDARRSPTTTSCCPRSSPRSRSGRSVRQGDVQWFNIVQVGLLRAAQRRGARRDARRTSTR